MERVERKLASNLLYDVTDCALEVMGRYVEIYIGI